MPTDQSHYPPPTIGLITALPCEYAAALSMLESPEEQLVPSEEDEARYDIGTISTRAYRRGHRVVLTLLPQTGPEAAAVRTTSLRKAFPTIKNVLMVGIAGGVPNPKKVDKHVRLGDVVVSNKYGVINFGAGALIDGEFEERNTPLPSSNYLLESCLRLNATATIQPGAEPWSDIARQLCATLNLSRPPDDTDVLRVFQQRRGEQVYRRSRHPEDARRLGQPLVFFGPIGSSSILLRDAEERDRLHKKHGLLAIEMEAAGVAQAVSMLRGLTFLIIRGVSDYCDTHKNDLWQPYAAVAAAAYARALIASIPGDLIPLEQPSEQQDFPTTLTNARGLLASFRRDLDGDVWPGQTDRILRKLELFTRYVDQLWLGLDSRVASSAEAARLRREKVVLRAKIHSDIRRFEKHLGEYRDLCRQKSVAAYEARDNCLRLLAQLGDAVEPFRMV